MLLTQVSLWKPVPPSGAAAFPKRRRRKAAKCLKPSKRSAVLTVTSQPSVAFKPNLLAFGYMTLYITYIP
jgi:hypothetical protein